MTTHRPAARHLTPWLLVAAALGSAAPDLAQGPPGSPGFVQFRGASFPVEESAGQVVVIVRRHNGTHGAVSVAYATVDGSARAGEDYVATTGTLTWADGEGEDKTLPIEIVADEVAEGLETFGVTLSDPTGGTLGALSTTVVRILPQGMGGDGEPGADRIRLRSAVFPAFESAGAATFVVVRQGTGVGAASVDFATHDGSATAPEDYAATTGTVSWADGETGEKSTQVALVDDAVRERNETISVVLGNAVGGALGGRDTASLLVIDNDHGAGDDSCVGDEETLCLVGDRFALSGSWTDPAGRQGTFRAVPSTEDSGLFWFFDASNVEVLVKVLAGCAINDHYWVFFSATTDVGYTLRVTDLATGAVRSYTNALGTRAPATTDVDAFRCSP